MRSAASLVKHRLRLLATWPVVVCASVSLPRTAAACSCGGEWTRADADVIFRGKVVEVHEPVRRRIRPRSRPTNPLVGVAWRMWFAASGTFDSDVRTVFEVETTWKGRPPQFVTINTGSGMCCDCSVGKIFEEGKEYLLYATRYRDELEISWCSGAVVVGKTAIDAEVATFGAGMKPTPGVRTPMFWRTLLLPAALATPLIFGLLIWSWKTRRRAA